MELLRGARSLLSFLGLVLYLLGFGTLAMYLWLLPARALRPARRRAYLSRFMKIMSHGLLGIMRLGGARFERRGTIDTSEPVLIVMNHQSLVDILSLTVMSTPHVPAFVTRTRYARFVPIIARSVRMLGGPNVDPERDARGSLRAVVEAAPRQDHGLIIFPEGHRSIDGELQPFKTAGVQAILAARPMPVQLVVTDGLWVSRRLVDFVFGIHRIRSRTEVLERHPAPGRDESAALLKRLRERLQEELVRLRSGAAA